MICIYNVIVSTRGIVLRTFNYRETSKIVEIFTENDGIVSLIAKGIRKQPKLIGILEPMNFIFVSYYKKKALQLHLLSKMETISSFHSLTKSFEKLTVGLAILDIVRQTQPTENPNLYLFHLTLSCLENLKSKDINPIVILVYFILKLTFDLGIDLAEKLIPLLNKNFIFIGFNNTNGEVEILNEKKLFPKIDKDTVEQIVKISKEELNNIKNDFLKSFKLIDFINFVEHYLSYYLSKTIKFNIINLFGYGS
ncbi:MAG: DNA repair protein RecO [Ignavibacteria bacterium]|nr:DNA repair protein RecO [Ignavibacteria bacterium]